ncbi:MAG: hypothetical protein V4750_05555 [Pseudomonadota bacterium]
MRGPHNIIRLIRTGATLERTGAMDVVLEALKLWRQVMGPRFPAAAGASKSLAATLVRPLAGVGLTFPATPVLPHKPGGFA